ncbi:MAG: phosphoribosylformylglycinamidine synthase [Hyphomicrobiales bacterium]|nr:phosphoribosylformylglycinamidine synthase [Hyphomicrobiales bacterium]
MTDARQKHREDAAKALRFMVVKAAVFIGVPIVASVVAVLTLL